jgi:DNA-binding response OmpR family regulator
MTVKVLVVDDDVHFARVIEQILARRGYDVRTAMDANGALSALGWRPEAVIVDLEMPSVDGWELCRRVRATANAPIVVAFGSNDHLSEVMALDAGADDYIGEPFAAQELPARMRAGFRRRARGNDASRMKRTRGESE